MVYFICLSVKATGISSLLRHHISEVCRRLELKSWKPISMCDQRLYNIISEEFCTILVQIELTNVRQMRTDKTKSAQISPKKILFSSYAHSIMRGSVNKQNFPIWNNININTTRTKCIARRLLFGTEVGLEQRFPRGYLQTSRNTWATCMGFTKNMVL